MTTIDDKIEMIDSHIEPMRITADNKVTYWTASMVLYGSDTTVSWYTTNNHNR